MNKCAFCGERHTRLKPNSKKLPAKYCSTWCIQTASRLRLNPNIKSYFGDKKGFWKTETGIGFRWEKYAADILEGKHMEFNKKGIDIVTRHGNLDVKVCEKYRNQWVFNKNKPKDFIDYYFCICLDGDKPVKHLLIPTGDFKGKGITVGTKSKYDKYNYIM